MTTVSQRDDLTLGQALTLWMSGREQLVPRDLVYPPDKSKDEIDEANNQEFKRSEDSAEYAALGYLKYAPAVTVETVNKDGASAGKLKEGDAIDAVNGTPVTDLEQFQALMEKTKPGDEVMLDFRRKNAPPGIATIKLGSAPDKEHGVLGIGVVEAPWAPFTIDFNLANIGGPSAGLVFSLAVIDKLTTGDLSGVEVRRGHRHHRRRRQSRLHRRHHPQDPGRARGGRDGVPRARRQLRRGQVGARRRHRPGQGREPRRCGGRAQGAFCRWRSTPLLTGTPVKPMRRVVARHSRRAWAKTGS